ncbi:MAG: hypothetical protein HS104_31815 [Polyangiaceae bacterium]|nr:hypothetical protein [Polyangiaceae bacterium]MCL4749073.1 hypothetical protein [Myxococcales bacterium]
MARGPERLTAVALLVCACSLTPLDSLKENTDAAAGGSPSSCERGVQCSGCSSCALFCDCVAAQDVVQCILGCQGGGAGGTSGGAGTGGAMGGSAGWAGSGVGGGGCNSTDRQYCADCCNALVPGGYQAYAETIDKCICGATAPCKSECVDYCNGAQLGNCYACLETPAAVECTDLYCTAACLEFNTCYYNCGS